MILLAHGLQFRVHAKVRLRIGKPNVLAQSAEKSPLACMQDESSEERKTLLDWAMRLSPDSPRKRVKEWIASGRYFLNGAAVTQAGLQMVDPGDALTMGPADRSTASWTHRQKIHPKVTVLYLDASIAVIDKAAGILSVPMEGYKALSALEVLGDYLNDDKGTPLRRRLFGSPEMVRPLPVHRLDQYTSGLFCIAMNADARQDLIEQLRKHELMREYIAYADATCHEDSGTWRHYLKLDSRQYEQAISDQPVDGSVEAVTHFWVDKIYPKNRVTRLRIRLETGLKHQIRIQAAKAGLPLIGDRLYHAGTAAAVKRKGGTWPYGFRRQALHASAIGLKHPVDGRELTFRSNLPADLVRLENRLS